MWLSKFLFSNILSLLKNSKKNKILSFLFFIFVVFFVIFLNIISLIYTDVNLFKIDIEQIKKENENIMKKLEYAIKKSYLINSSCILFQSLIVAEISSRYEEIFNISNWFLTIIFIFFAELIPNYLVNFFGKNKHYSEILTMKLFLNSAYFISKFSPLNILFFWNSNKNNKIFDHSEEDLIRLVNNLTSKEILLLEPKEAQLVNLAFKLDDSEIKKIFIPNEKVKFLNVSMKTEEVEKICSINKVTKYPVLDEEKKYLGVFNIRNLIGKRSEDPYYWLKYVQKRFNFMDSETKISEALEILKNSDDHFSIVKENGVSIGIITLRNVLTSLIGKIDEESF